MNSQFSQMRRLVGARLARALLPAHVIASIRYAAVLGVVVPIPATAHAVRAFPLKPCFQNNYFPPPHTYIKQGVSPVNKIFTELQNFYKIYISSSILNSQFSIPSFCLFASLRFAFWQNSFAYTKGNGCRRKN